MAAGSVKKVARITPPPQPSPAAQGRGRSGAPRAPYFKETDRFYLWEDIYIKPGRVTHYLPNMGTDWSFDPALRYPLFGLFGHLRPMGHAPRGMNLWEGDWKRITGMLSEQFGAKPPAHGFENWWARSNVDRAGGWDRLMIPGPGSLTLQQIARGDKRPCVVQQIVRLRQGARDDYLQWFGGEVAPAVEKAGWKALKWMGAIHSSLAITLVAAPDWSRLLDLAEVTPHPDPAWGADVDSHAMQAWAGCTYLQR